MTALKIIFFLVGLAFLLVGYFIYFKKKYHLINGFPDYLLAGDKDERYARRVGLVELILGLVFLAAALLLTLLA